MTLAFGNHRLDLGRRELRCGGDLIELEPKAFDLLTFLVLNRDRVVSRDELLQGVWDGRVVSESALTTRINAVRRALGDDGAAQRLVRTFIRKGFRFIGDVTDLAEETSAAASGSLSQAEKPSIAVLSFENLTGDPHQAYFVAGIVEEITTAIARFPWLLVIARNAAFDHKSRAIDIGQEARALGVRYVLDGSVRKSGNRVRIASQLIDTMTDAHIWAERFDGRTDDVFDLQDQLASGVAGAIEPRLRLAEIERAGRKPTGSLSAYDLCLRAQAMANKRSRGSMAESVRLARSALELDPGYVPAMARLALSQMMRRSRHWVRDVGPDAEEGIRMARQAIAAGGDDPWVLDFAGLTLSTMAGDNGAALCALDRAIALNPNFALAFGHRALILAYAHRPEEAILSALQAIRLSPRDPAMFAFCEALALAHLTLGRDEEGLRWAEAAIRENSGLPGLRYKLALCGHLGRFAEARECCRRIGEVHAQPTIAGLLGTMPKGLASEVASRFVEGLQKADIPEE